MSERRGSAGIQTPRDRLHALVARLCWQLGRVDPADLFRSEGTVRRGVRFQRARMRRGSLPAYRAAVLVMIERYGMTTSTVGQFFAGRDHSTICHSHVVARARMRDDPAFAAVVAAELAQAADELEQHREHLAIRSAAENGERLAAEARAQAEREAAEALRVYWCGQCEARVTGARVAACSGRCKPEELPAVLDDDFEGELAA